MKFFRIDLLTLLISLFILSGCKNQDGIGLSVDSSQALNGTLIDSATVTANTVKESDVATGGLGKTPLGYFTDPVIGTITSNMAMGLSLPGASAYTLPAGTITIDSVRLILRYADGFYGDSLASRYKVNVYQLAEKPLSTVIYYNTKVWSVSNNLLGSLLITPRPKTKFYIYDIVSGAKDTLIKVSPQLRIPISPAFINNNLFSAPATQLASNTVFQDAVKGLYVTLDKTQTTGAGGTMMFALDSSSVAVYYRANNAGTIDTTLITMPLGLHAAEIQYNYSTAVKTELSDTISPRNIIYLQGLGGLRARISFPYIKKILTTIGKNIVINRAELVITPAAGTTIPYVPQPKITMYQLDIAKQRTYLQDASAADKHFLGASVFGGYYSSKKDYHFIVTGYIQDLMNGKTVDYGTYIAPVDTLNTQGVDITATVQTAGRVIAIGGDKTSPYRIKLNLIYTKINQ